MPLSDRDYIRGTHPPNCTCKECTERRLQAFRGRSRSEKKPPKQKDSPPPTKNKKFNFLGFWGSIPPGILKFIFSLLVIAGLVDIIRRGYLLFTSQTEPVKGVIIFLVELALWIWIITVLRRRKYKYRQPKFKFVLLAVIFIALVCTFAGIEPLSSYKDDILARFTAIQEAEETTDLLTLPDENEEELTEDDTEVNGEEPEFPLPLTLGVSEIRKAIHTGQIKPPGIKIDVFVTLIKESGTGEGTFYVTLKTDEENFGSQEIYWPESLEGTGLSWDIEPDCLAFTELQTNKPCSEIIQVEISSKAPNEVDISEQEYLVEEEVVDIPEDKDVKQDGEEPTTIPLPTEIVVSDVEKLTFQLINLERERNGAPATVWDDRLYELSKKHTEKMAERGELFHSTYGADYGENCWGGEGYYRYSDEDLASVIVESWMSSPLHRAWLLHAPIKESVVSIINTSDGQYSSWTFWISKLASGPQLVVEISREWQATSGGMPWIEWLKMKGYID